MNFQPITEGLQIMGVPEDISIDGAKPVPGYEGRYSVTACGMVWSHPNKTHKTGRWLRQQDNGKGYKFVYLYRGTPKQKQQAYVHRVVATAWLGTAPEGQNNVNHKDGVKCNNSVGNLEWSSYLENNRHSFSTGLALTAAFISRRKFSSQQIRSIRSRFKAGKSRILHLAKEYGVTHSSIQGILNGKNYRHVTEE